MRVIIDTNIILDIFLKREPFVTASYGVIRKALIDESDALVTTNAVTDIYYMLRRDMKDAAKAKGCIEHLLQLVSLADVLQADVKTALQIDMSDFEDALISAVAQRCKADYIVTRNMNNSKIKYEV